MIHFLTFHYHFLPKYILPDTQPAHLFLNHLHCKWNNSGFLSGITKWFYHTMLHTHGYNWWKFEDLTPTSLDSTEHQNVCNLMWKVLYRFLRVESPRQQDGRAEAAVPRVRRPGGGPPRRPGHVRVHGREQLLQVQRLGRPQAPLHGWHLLYLAQTGGRVQHLDFFLIPATP